MVAGASTDSFLDDLSGQGAAILRAAIAMRDQSEALSTLGRRRPDGVVVFTGMGGSYHACYAAATLLSERGVLTTMVDAAELLHYRASALTSNALVVAVSQSGESAEVVRLLRGLRRRSPEARPAIVSVTNGLGNATARSADVALDTRAGREGGVSTRTFGAALVVLAAVADLLSGRSVDAALRRVGSGARDAARDVTRILQDRTALERALREWRGSRTELVVLGRGCARAASEMGALTLKEAARLPAESLESGQFRHGPLELAGPQLAAVVVGTEPTTARLDRALAADLARAGASTLLITAGGSGSGNRAGSVLQVDIGGAPRDLRPAAAIVPIQFLAHVAASDRGIRPGQFVHTSKVTTRE
jgi:glucosamine--fructose-6-phosphate aminotransferase (isomerizing)